MTTDREASFVSAVNEIKSISDELSRLKGAVQSHDRAAEALGNASAEMGKLCVLLQALPQSMSSHLDRAGEFLEATQTAFAPAGKLATGIDDVGQAISATATSENLASAVKQLSDETRTSAVAVGAKAGEIIQVATRGLDQGIKDSREHLATRIEVLSGELRPLSERLLQAEAKSEVFSKAILELDAKVTKQGQVSEHQSLQVQEKLAGLERLARRSLFAILMGRDPQQSKK